MDYKTNKLIAWVGFIISPLSSLAISFKYYKEDWAKNILWAFVAFYAFHFVISNDKQDMNAYVYWFLHYRNMDISYWDFIKMQYSEGSSTLDILEPSISYIVGLFTGNHRFLFLIYGLIYGFFYSRNIWFFLTVTSNKIDIRTLTILFLLVMTIGIWEINGIRFWLASHIFIYGTINYVYFKNKRGLLFYIISAFTHIGLLYFVIVSISYKFLKRDFITLLFIIFLLTSFFLELNIEFIKQYISNYIPDFMNHKIGVYADEDYILSVKESKSEFTLPYQIFSRVGYAIRILFVIILYLNRDIYREKRLYNFFSFYLFIGIFANLINVMASGNRYVSIANFMLYGIMLIFTFNFRKFKAYKVINFMLPIIAIYSLYLFQSFGIRTFSIHHFINNPIVSFFTY